LLCKQAPVTGVRLLLSVRMVGSPGAGWTEHQSAGLLTVRKDA
jgi:hypothetical protein